MYFEKEMIRRKTLLLYYLWLFIFITSCGTATSQPASATTMDTKSPVPTINVTTELPLPTPLPTFTPDLLSPPNQYETPIPALPKIPTAPVFVPLLQTSSPSLSETVQPTFTQESEPFSLDKLRMVYEIDGNIYRRDGANPPKQLTYSGEDRDPILSGDGDKVIFYRGKSDENVYSINANGSNEQLIIKSQLLPILAQGDIKALTFVPNTHFMLFNTYLCNESKALYNASDCSVGVYSVNVDSGEIRAVVNGLSGNRANSRNFQISPDGAIISITAAGHLDLYYFSSGYSDITHPDALRYYRTMPDEYLPDQYWLPDSSGLFAVITLSQSFEPSTAPSPYAVLRYTINDEQGVQIPLEMPIVANSGCNYSISPDGNWILYLSDENSAEIKMPSLYLGNLNNGQSQRIDWEFFSDCPSSYYGSRWSPDGKYYGFERKLFSPDGISISIDGYFSRWIDSTHYFYLTYQENQQPLWKVHIGEIGGNAIELPKDFIWQADFVILD